VDHRGIHVDGRGEDLITDKSLLHHRALRHATCTGRSDRAPSVCWTRSTRARAGMGHPKAVALGQPAGFLTSRPLWPWAAMSPEGIVGFSNFSLDLFN
jgi:hypothetical protein